MLDGGVSGVDIATMSTAELRVREEGLEVLGRGARIFHGGAGPAVLLIHGGWGGARCHWETVFEPLAESFEVVAPDLPGFEDGVPGGPHSVDDYADWLVALLDALGLSRAVCVGNSFGASVAWSLACRHPDRCEALVVVNGIPMPRTPLPLRLLGALDPARAVLRRQVKRIGFTPGALAKAFRDPSRAPMTLRHMLSSPRQPQLERTVDAMILGGSTTAPPHARTLLLWGAADRLQRTTPEDAVKLQRAIPGAMLMLIPDAGHLPQRERPEEFVASLRGYLATKPRG